MRIHKNDSITVVSGALLFALTLGSSSARANNKHEDIKFEGGYEVPTNDPELIEAAKSETTYKLRFKNGRIVRMIYDLPMELTGVHQSIALKPVDSSNLNWTGPNSEGTCTEEATGITCTLVYKNLVLDPDLAKLEIAQRYGANPGLSALKGRVMESFQAEPNGVIRIPGAGYGP